MNLKELCLTLVPGGVVVESIGQTGRRAATRGLKGREGESSGKDKGRTGTKRKSKANKTRECFTKIGYPKDKEKKKEKRKKVGGVRS